MTSQRPIRVAHVATVDMTVRFLLRPQLVALRDEGFDVTAISAGGAHIDADTSFDIRHIPWKHITRSWAPGSDLRALRELREIFRAERFDIVHTHTPKAGLLGRVAARSVGTPSVVNTVHGYWASPDHALPRRLSVLGLEWVGARFSDRELFQSAEDLAWARRRGIVRPDQSVWLGNGTDVTSFRRSAVPIDRCTELRAELGIHDGDVIVGMVGRMVAEKGYREVFEAARIVRSRFPNVRFLAVGEPDASKDDAIGPRDMAAASGDVIFAGWRSDVRDLLAIMDVFVLASWREGMPRSAIEAAAMGLPLVLTNIRGCREVVQDGVQGLLVPPRDHVALADAICRLVGDDESRAVMGKRARERAEDCFDERQVVSRVVQVYGELLEARPGGRMKTSARAGGPSLREGSATGRPRG